MRELAGWLLMKKDKGENKDIVFVIEDDSDVVSAIKILLDSVNIKTEVFNNAQDYLQYRHQNECGSCLLVDVRLPGMSGLELLERLKEVNNWIPVVVVTAYGNVPMAVRALHLGAADFIMKPFNDQVFLETIYSAIQLSKKCSPALIKMLPEYAKLFNQLTAREKEVLKMLAEGKLNKQVAHALGIAFSTVELYRSRIIKKMKVKNILALVRIYALLEKEI